MADSEITLTNDTPFSKGISNSSTIELPDDDPVVVALGLGKAGGAQPKATESAVEKTDATKTEPATGEVKPPDGKTAEAKPEKVPYTEDELKVLLADPNATLDTSRLDAKGQAIHKEFQRGYTKKFEELKREKDAIERQRQEIDKYRAEQKRLQEEQRFQKEKEELGEEEAARLKKERDTENRLRDLEYRLQVAQRNETSEAFRRAFTSVAPKYQMPVDQDFENLSLSFVWAINEDRTARGEPGITLEDGVSMIADKLGFTNPGNFEKMISANPKNKEAYDQKIINDYLQKKAAGPTMVSSTQASVPEKSLEKEVQLDIEAYRKNPSAELERLVELRLKQT